MLTCKVAVISEGKQAQVLAVTTMDEIKKMMTEFVEDTKAGNHAENGWGQSAYITSKLGVTLMSMVQQAELDASGKEDIVVNAACPGFVDTDMTSEFTAPGKLTIDQGAEKLLRLALLTDNVQEPRGKFLSDKKVVEWK